MTVNTEDNRYVNLYAILNVACFGAGFAALVQQGKQLRVRVFRVRELNRFFDLFFDLAAAHLRRDLTQRIDQQAKVALFASSTRDQFAPREGWGRAR